MMELSPLAVSAIAKLNTDYFTCLPLLYWVRRLVLETLEPLPQDRKCFRMINGVLVERTVKDVVPALKTNSEGLKKVLDELLKQYKRQQGEMEKWKVSYLIDLSVVSVSIYHGSLKTRRPEPCLSVAVC